MEYESVFGLDNICKRFNDASHDQQNHFVEGLQYGLDEAVLMTAVMVPDHEVDHRNVNGFYGSREHFRSNASSLSLVCRQINDIGKWYKPWFFKHVENILRSTPNGEKVVEYLPLRDYYHRHTRALFWELQVGVVLHHDRSTAQCNCDSQHN